MKQQDRTRRGPITVRKGRRAILSPYLKPQLGEPRRIPRNRGNIIASLEDARIERDRSMFRRERRYSGKYRYECY